MKVSIDGVNKLIVVNGGITSLDTQIDLYSDWKEWMQTEDNAKFLPAFRTTGGDLLPGGLGSGAYFFLRNDFGWRIRPQEADHELIIMGNLYPQDSAYPMFVPTLGEFTVALQLERSNLTQVSSNTDALQGIQDKVNFIASIEGGRWKIVNNQMIFYDSDNETEIARFNLYDKNGQPSEENVFERQ